MDCHKTISHNAMMEVLSVAHFDDLLSGSAVSPFFQPIVDLRDGHVIGLESLGRSSLPGLETPAEMFRMAEQFNAEAELSRIMRHRAMEAAAVLPSASQIFVNTHPAEMNDPNFLDSLRSLRRDFPDRNITLEIHELAITGATSILEIRELLDELGMRLAFDDFGAGQTRLLELIDTRPDFLKFDRSLLKDIANSSTRHKEMLAALVGITRKLNVIPIAEGIETASEDQFCRDIGFELGQGFLYSRPAAAATFAER